VTAGAALLALAGLGLVLAGLRLLVTALDAGVVQRLRPLCSRISRGALRPLLTGFGATAVGLQASAITVIGAMALLQRSLLSLEAALFVMLGATVGTCAKAWLFVLPFEVLGPVLVGAASLALVAVRRAGRRRLLEVAFAVGLMFLGWRLIAGSLGGALEAADLAGLAADLAAGGALGLVGAVVFGALLTALVQSSSTVVFLVMGAAVAGDLPFEVLAAVVLGANVGTTVTPLLASLEYGLDVRRLALTHVAVKAVGVLLAGVFFGGLLAVAGLLCEALGVTSAAGRLAAVHTTFNVLNVLLWTPFVARLARRSAGERRPGRGALLESASVRRLLANVPGEATAELRAERDRLLQELKIATDGLVAALDAHEDAVHDLVPRHDLLARALAGQELLAAVGVARPELRRLMRELNAIEDVIEEGLALTRRLQSEPPRFRRLRRRRVAPALATYRAVTEAAWGEVLTGAPATLDAEAFDRFEAEAHRLLAADPTVSEHDVVALGKEIAHLQRILLRLQELRACVRPGPAARAAGGDEDDGDDDDEVAAEEAEVASEA